MSIPNIPISEQDRESAFGKFLAAIASLFKSHFLICFLAMVLLKLLQKQISGTYRDEYRDNPLSIDMLIDTLRGFKFRKLPKYNYTPMFKRTMLSDQLQALANIETNNEIISVQRIRGLYKKS